MRRRQSGKFDDDLRRWHSVLAATRVTRTQAADRESVVELHIAPAVQALLDEAVELLQHVGDIADDAAALRAPSTQREAWTRLSDIQQLVDRVRIETAYLRSRGFLPCRFDAQDDGPDQVDHVWRRPDHVADSLGLTPAMLGYEPSAIKLTSPPTPLRAWLAAAVEAGAYVATQSEAERALKLRRGLAKQREWARMTPFRDEAEGRRVLAEQEDQLLSSLGLATASV